MNIHINVMLKYTIHVNYIYNTNIDFYVNQTVKSNESKSIA